MDDKAPGEKIVAALTAAMIILLLVSGHIHEALLLALLIGGARVAYALLVKKLA